MTYDDFAVEVQAAGLSPEECRPTHWQILGGETYPIVNVWGTSDRDFCFQAGAWPAKTMSNGGLQEAIRCAGPPGKGASTSQPKAPRLKEITVECRHERVGLVRRLWRWIW